MAEKKVLDNQCPSCKAPIVFDAASGKFKCDYCSNSYTVEELKSAASKAEVKTEVEETATEDNTEYVSFNCPDCGAQVICDEHTEDTFCVSCGNVNIIHSRLEGKFAPSKIIPFKKTKEEAKAAFLSLKKGRPFLPKDFTEEKNIEKITGVYIPFWLYDIKVDGAITATGTKVTSWSSGDTHYTKTDYYEFTRDGSMDFNMVPVDGSTKFDNDIMNTIEPFDFSELIDYNHAYLSGFLAEKYDVDAEKAFGDAQARVSNSAKDIFVGTIHATSVVVTNNGLVPNIKEKHYVMLPVYMVNTKYQDKYYLFAMNGQTGEFVGNMPIDKKKAVLWAVGIFALVVAIVFIISVILYFGGGKYV